MNKKFHNYIVKQIDENIFSIDITEDMKNMFGNEIIKNAFIKFEWDLSKQGPYDEYIEKIVGIDEKGIDLDYSNDVYITFTSGVQIAICVSEWGTLSVENN